MVGSIVAYNNGTVDGEYTLSNCSVENATIDSLGYNLENGTECGFKSTGDLQNTSPEFGSGETLQNNGGSTDTFTLEPTSPAVDAIPTSAPFCDGTDQRGIARPQGTGCDIGAVELVPFTIAATEGSQFSGPVTVSLTGGLYPSPLPTIEWGDGTASEGTVDEANSTVSGAHTYARAGTYDGSVTYYNDNGSGTHTIAFQAKVADAALSATGVPVSATAGVQFTGDGGDVHRRQPGKRGVGLHGDDRLGRWRLHHSGDDRLRGRRGLHGHGLAHLRQGRRLSDQHRDQRRGGRHRHRHEHRHRDWHDRLPPAADARHDLAADARHYLAADGSDDDERGLYNYGEPGWPRN